MPKLVDVPQVGVVEFPDSMNDDQIVGAIKTHYYSMGAKFHEQQVGAVKAASDVLESPATAAAAGAQREADQREQEAAMRPSLAPLATNREMQEKLGLKPIDITQRGKPMPAGAGLTAADTTENVKRETWGKLGALDKLIDDAFRTVRGAASAMGGALEGMGIASAFAPPIGTSDFPGAAQTEQISESLERRKKMTGEEKQAAVEGSPLTQAGRAVQDKAARAFPSNKPESVSRPLGALAEGVGNLASIVPLSLAGGPTTALTAGAFMELSDAYNREIDRQRGAGEKLNPEKAMAKAQTYAAAATAIEAKLGVGRVIQKIEKYFGGEAADAVRKGGFEALGRFAKERAKDFRAGFMDEASQRLTQDLIVDGKPNLAAIVQEGLIGGGAQAVALGGASLTASAVGATQQRSSFAAAEKEMDAVMEQPAVQGMREREAQLGGAAIIEQVARIEPVAPLTAAALREQAGVPAAEPTTTTEVAPEVTPEVAPVAPKPQSLAEAWEQYDGTGELGIRDLVDTVEALVADGKAPKSLQRAVDAYREAKAEDYTELAGRGDMDAAATAFESAVRRAIKPAKQQAVEPAVAAPAEVDVSPILNAKTEKEMLEIGGGMMAKGKTSEELGQIQAAMKAWKAPEQSQPPTAVEPKGPNEAQRQEGQEGLQVAQAQGEQGETPAASDPRLAPKTQWDAVSHIVGASHGYYDPTERRMVYPDRKYVLAAIDKAKEMGVKIESEVSPKSGTETWRIYDSEGKQAILHREVTGRTTYFGFEQPSRFADGSSGKPIVARKEVSAEGTTLVGEGSRPAPVAEENKPATLISPTVETATAQPESAGQAPAVGQPATQSGASISQPIKIAKVTDELRVYLKGNPPMGPLTAEDKREWLNLFGIISTDTGRRLRYTYKLSDGRTVSADGALKFTNPKAYERLKERHRSFSTDAARADIFKEMPAEIQEQIVNDLPMAEIAKTAKDYDGLTRWLTREGHILGGKALSKLPEVSKRLQYALFEVHNAAESPFKSGQEAARAWRMTNKTDDALTILQNGERFTATIQGSSKEKALLNAGWLDVTPKQPAPAPVATEQPVASAEQPAPSAEPQTEPTAPARYTLRNQGPQTYTIVERLQASDIEQQNGEQPVRIRNERTGAEQTVLEAELQPVKGTPTTKAEKRDLDQELRDAGLDPDVFRNADEKRAALKRAKALRPGPGASTAADVGAESAAVASAQRIAQFINDANAPAKPEAKKKDAIPEADRKSAYPEVEERWQAARLSKLTLRQRAAEAIALARAVMTRHFQYLDPKTDGVLSDILRRFEQVPLTAKYYASQALRGITAGLRPDQYEVFQRVIILRDLMQYSKQYLADAESLYGGGDLPFGYSSVSAIEIDLARFEKTAEANPEITAAIARRQEMIDALRYELVARDLLPEEVKDFGEYYHHQVLHYMAMKESGNVASTGSADVRNHTKGWQRKRVGSVRDYNTNYLESEFEVVSQSFAQIFTKDTLGRLQEVADISASLKEAANQINEERGEGEKVTWEKMIPEDHQTWQPQEGHHFYWANSVGDKLLESFLRGEKQLTEADFKKVLAMGGMKEQWVIPKRLAKTLDEWNTRQDGPIGKFLGAGLSQWKRWRLFNPWSNVTYQVNNLSGDFDMAFAADPAIISQHSKYAASELWKFVMQQKAGTQEVNQLIESGVIDSDFSVQELPDLKGNQFFRVLEGKNPNLIARYWNKELDFNRWREGVLRMAAYNRALELLREGKRPYWASKDTEMDAMYSSDKVRPEEIAAKLAREVIGDYGNISVAGQWIRSKMIPFWSWMEINAPRYYRLFKNLSKEERGRIVKVAAKRAAVRVAVGKFTTTSLAIRAGMLYMLFNLWNKTFFPDEDAELQATDNGNQFRVILGRREDGTIITIRLQGALSDALSWFGGEDIVGDVQDVALGRASLKDKLVQAAKAPVNKLWNASLPFHKTLLEIVVQRTTFPDLFNPRPMRDRLGHVAKLFGFGTIYNYLTQKPQRPGTWSPLALVAYTTDPGEAAYYTARSIVSEYLEEKGKESPPSIPVRKGNALYYYKQAKKYKDERLMKYWEGRYKALGGTDTGMQQSITMSSPTYGVEGKADFENSLSPAEKQIIAKAKAWYNKTYR